MADALLTHGSAALGAELAVSLCAADGAGLFRRDHFRHRLVLSGFLGGFHLRDLGLGGVDGLHHVADGVGDLTLVLVDEPLADDAVVLVDLPLLAGNGDGELGQFSRILCLVRGNSGHVPCLLGQFIKKSHLKIPFLSYGPWPFL